MLCFPYQLCADGKTLLDTLQTPVSSGSSNSITAKADYTEGASHVLDVVHDVSTGRCDNKTREGGMEGRVNKLNDQRIDSVTQADGHACMRTHTHAHTHTHTHRVVYLLIKTET